MRAIQFRTYGDPSVLECVQVPTPGAGKGDAVVQVKSASVNPSDVKNVAGHFGRGALPRIPGRDFSGVVVAGPGEWVGREVWGTGGDLGITRDGTHAEFIRIAREALVPKPQALTHEQAAAVGVNFVAAWLGTIEYAQLERGERIAVIGISGGVGGAVAQIAAWRGCAVIGVDRVPPPPGSPAARALEAYVPIEEASARLSGPAAGADVVFDAVGGVVFETALSLAKRRGRVVEISATGRRRVEFDLIDFYHNETQLLGVDTVKLDVTATAALMVKFGEGFASGAFHAPVIAARYPLERAREAYQAVAEGTPGRIVITIP